MISLYGKSCAVQDLKHFGPKFSYRGAESYDDRKVILTASRPALAENV